MKEKMEERNKVNWRKYKYITHLRQGEKKITSV
jgi:hypothetical protein